MQRHAWHLELTDGHHIAIAKNQVIEYLSNQSGFPIPDCNKLCNQVIDWRQKILPILGCTNNNNTLHQHILIIHFSSNTDQKETLIALSLKSPPSLIQVDDSNACKPSDDLIQYWNSAILSCFEEKGVFIPIINFYQLEHSRPLD